MRYTRPVPTPHTHAVSKHDWDALSHVEQCFLINAMEMDILPGVYGDLTSAEQELPLNVLATILLSMVDRGWVEVRRYDRWISPKGEDGLIAGDLVPRETLPAVLADPTSWDYYAGDNSWVGALTLVRTEAGRVVSSLSPEEIEARDRAKSSGPR